MTETRLELTRDRILTFRRRSGALDSRLQPGAESLRRAAWAGLQDSMPRAALLSIHARVERTETTTLDDSSLVQIWGPRFSAYVVAARDVAVFTIGRLSDDAKSQAFAHGLADELEAFLDGRRLGYGAAGDGMGIPANRLRYAAPTGRVLIRWDGARQPTVWTVPAPDLDPAEARCELARRYLHVFGPGSAAGFTTWAGVGAADGRATFEALARELVAVTTPIGASWILAADEAVSRDADERAEVVRLLPSGDAYTLFWGADRDLLVPDAANRAALWTPRVWPGAVLSGGEIVGTWRRAGVVVQIDAWRRLSPSERAAIEDEAAALPLPGIERSIRVRWG